MIIGFLGKGGSGKSTLSTHFVQFCHANEKTVLAIDADHNLDLTHNLLTAFGHNPQATIPYFGDSLGQLTERLDPTGSGRHYSEHFLATPTETRFSLAPLDPYLSTFTSPITNKLRLMSAGPHTEQILRGDSCSHSLFTPLKVLLPLLTLRTNEIAIIDEKAGRDGAGTGVTTGFTLAVVCVEPTPHSIKAANQIAELLEYYETPYLFLMNKVKDVATAETTAKDLKASPFGHIPLTDEFSSEIVRAIFKKILSHSQHLLDTAGDQRFEKTRRKFSKKMHS